MLPSLVSSFWNLWRAELYPFDIGGWLKRTALSGLTYPVTLGSEAASSLGAEAALSVALVLPALEDRSLLCLSGQFVRLWVTLGPTSPRPSRLWGISRRG